MVWEITAEELLARYGNGERNFAGIELIQSEGAVSENPIDLEGAILREINLRGAYLRNAFLVEADLTGADLTGADLTGAVLIEACLSRAIVRDANLHSANLHWCDLTEADLRGTNLNHMNATSANFGGAKSNGFEHAILIETNFRNARIAPNVIWSCGNFVYNTVMPDGTIKSGPFFGGW